MVKSRKGIICSILFLFTFFIVTEIHAQKTTKKPGKPVKNINKEKQKRTTTGTDTIINPIKDSDGDGIEDSLDKCPDEKGVIQYDGCPMPDSDNDGLTDDLDQCPTEVGLIKYKGCSVPDTDGDRINDEDDKCPEIAGVARNNGCPPVDTDKDGIDDDFDKCKNVAGTINNDGCPEKGNVEQNLHKEKRKKK